MNNITKKLVNNTQNKEDITMKRTTLALLGTTVAGTIASVVYVRKEYDKKATELGYTYNKDTKQYEIKYNGNLYDGIAFSTEHMLDKYIMERTKEKALEKAGKVLFSVSFLVGFICGIINRKNR